MNDRFRHRFDAVLLALFAIVFALSAVGPHDRGIWVLENVLVLSTLGVLAVHYRRFALSGLSHALLFAFLVLHEIGAHYTYERVPYAAWIPGFSNGGRNHYDRIVHFAFGLLLAAPIREGLRRLAGASGFWSYFLALQAVMAASMAYELFEWAGALMVEDSTGEAFLGAQGDPWDTHKDLALATLGAAMTLLLNLLRNLVRQPDFRQEWKRSVSIYRRERRGDVADARPGLGRRVGHARAIVSDRS